jgi:hypothetical protein
MRKKKESLVLDIQQTLYDAAEFQVLNSLFFRVELIYFKFCVGQNNYILIEEFFSDVKAKQELIFCKIILIEYIVVLLNDASIVS